ncbi:MAG: carbamoyl transferase [Candidatus Omnitrophica bacterium]|nr:carbamoyl transferase [Candidatus Omnitrophota bacterium]
MKILSIHWGTNSTAALMIAGDVVACVSEERFSRFKNDESFPLHAIEAVLKIGNVRASDLGLVAVSGERFDPTGILCHKWSKMSVRDRLKEQHDYWYPRLFEGKEIPFLDLFKEHVDTAQFPGKQWNEAIDFLYSGDSAKTNAFFMDFRRDCISRHLGIAREKVIFIHHHRAHGYYAYYASPMKKEKTLILTADAWGDDMNASVSVADDKGIRLLSSSQNFIIGRLYRYITLLLGMKPDEHEYKVMGLAAYAKPGYFQKELGVFSNTMFVNGLGFDYKEKPSDLYFYFKNKFEGSRFDNIAGAIQKYTEDILADWTDNALKETGAKRLCFGGGVAMNIKAVMDIVKLPSLKGLFICPTPSDESLAIGSAYVAMHDICIRKRKDPRKVLKPIKNAYLGPQATERQIKDVVKASRAGKYSVKKDPDPGYIAELLEKGVIIGRCVARSEFGARALGNRSIIADPRNPEVIKVINEKIKCRDFWMPFAPSILEEEADKYLVNPKSISAPYMTIAFQTKKAAWKDLKAGLHQYDLTVRPQVVSREMNPAYHALISAFHKHTGIGGVLNTSFNIHGEPIVQTPQDAFGVFERGDLNALLIDGYLIERK